MADDSKKIILIVDNSFLSVKLESDLLEKNGFKVLRASCGKEAFDILKFSTPDLILLDINLPDITGYEIFNKIKQDERFKNVKILAVSGSVMKEDEWKIKSTGFDGFITKPIDIKDFVKQVKDRVI
ncbi:MAG: response regulator [Candidatus Omnitrophota bacterium]|jgi:two-component system cell cycle response regulator DivK